MIKVDFGDGVHEAMSPNTHIKKMKPKVGDFFVLTAAGVNARRRSNGLRNASIGEAVG